MNVPKWRRECTLDRREHLRDSDNRAKSVATVYWSNDGGFGFAWMREPAKTRWI